MTLDEFLTKAVNDVVEDRWYPRPQDCPCEGCIGCLNPPAEDGRECSVCVEQGCAP